ncbi:MAG: CapA family protein [Syntrophomonas sp.]
MDKTICYKSNSYRRGKNLLFILIISILNQSCNKTNSDVHVLFVGDILLSRNVSQELQIKNSSPWSELKPTFQSAELVIGNLEGAVGKIEDQFISDSDSPVFNIDSSYISLLSKAGFKIITLENNHSFDLGASGKENTIQALLHNDIAPIFFDNSPQFFTVKNVVIALIVINLVPGRDFNKSEIPSIELKQKLRLAKSLANIVVVSVHWGSELLDWPNNKQRENAEWLVSNGADLIIGSHPHVIQQPELIKGKPVFFSLGNHLFDQKYPSTKEGLIVDLFIHKNKFNCSGIITHTKVDSYYPKIIETKNFKFKPFQFRDSPFKINDYILKPVSVSENHQNRTVLRAYRNGKIVWETHPMSIISITSSKLDDKNEFLIILERHYSNMDGETNIRPYVYQVDDKGLIAKWRGSALAWPLLDATISPYDNSILCALHRGDSFINPDSTNTSTRVAAYKWNGFGFTGLSDSVTCKSCEKLFSK